MFDIVSQLAALLAGPNGPEAAAMLDQAGVPVPTKASLLGGPRAPFTPPERPQPPSTGPIMGMEDDLSYARGGTGTTPPAAQPQAGMGQDLTKLGLAAAKGVKAPEPVKPLMSGGVTGGVKVPEAKMDAGAGTQALQALLAALGPGAAGKDPLRVPTLGAIMGGRR